MKIYYVTCKRDGMGQEQKEMQNDWNEKRDYHLGRIMVEGQIGLRAKCFQVF
jgi:hypothetical protein